MTSKSTSPYATTYAFLLFLVIAGLALITQEIWTTISGLFFPYAYEIVVIPYLMYVFYSMYKYTASLPVNNLRLTIMLFAYALLFTPSAYLWLTSQLDFHSMVFSEFDATLNHMPYAQYLPFIALIVLFAPLPSGYKKGSNNEPLYFTKEKLDEHTRDFGTYPQGRTKYKKG